MSDVYAWKVLLDQRLDRAALRLALLELCEAIALCENPERAAGRRGRAAARALRSSRPSRPRADVSR